MLLSQQFELQWKVKKFGNELHKLIARPSTKNLDHLEVAGNFDLSRRDQTSVGTEFLRYSVAEDDYQFQKDPANWWISATDDSIQGPHQRTDTDMRRSGFPHSYPSEN